MIGCSSYINDWRSKIFYGDNGLLCLQSEDILHVIILTWNNKFNSHLYENKTIVIELHCED